MTITQCTAKAYWTEDQDYKYRVTTVSKGITVITIDKHTNQSTYEEFLD